MPSIEGQKEGAVTMEDGFAEMHAQRPVQGLVTRLGGPPWVEAGMLGMEFYPRSSSPLRQPTFKVGAHD